MNQKRLIKFYRRRRKEGQALVLATVFETEGSTYSKAGQQILIAEDGRYQGLLSGGCLEGDLAEHARLALGRHRAEAVRYDLRGPDQDVFGLGVGCDGMFRVLLQPLDERNGYEPFATMAECLTGHERGALALVVDSNAADVPAGAALLECPGNRGEWQVPARLHEVLRRHCLRAMEDPLPALHTHDDPRDRFHLLCMPLRPLPRLLVLGAGPDAVPLVEFADRLGWRVTVLDHRPAYLDRGDLAAAELVRTIEPARLAEKVKLERIDAVVVMSHHLATDQTYLEQLSVAPVAYVGLLGPRGRRDRLLAGIGARAAGLEGRLHAPVGLDIGADSPESIALAICAELQSLFGRADRRPSPDGRTGR